MADEESKTYGKSQLNGASYGADLSGQDFDSVYLEPSQSLSHSFLNGTSFKDSTFLGAPIDQAELAEAHIIDCTFDRTDFTGSSFISAKVERTTFRDCVFADGEWRKSRFKSVIFQNCDFNYTTINLCVFEDCDFLKKGGEYLENRSVNYNVFSRSRFDTLYEDDVVLANNFGLPSKGARKSLTHVGSGISLEEICIKSSSARTVVSELVDAIEHELRSAKAHRLKIMRLEFVSNIVAALAKTNGVSAGSLTYLEAIFLSVAKDALSEADALAAMSAVLNIRSLLFDLMKHSIIDSEFAEFPCQAIEIRYQRTYTQYDVLELAKILGELANGTPNTFAISRFANGSTMIELLSMQVVSVGAILTAINFILRQVNTTLLEARKIRENTVKLLSPAPKATRKRKRKVVSRVQALQHSGVVPKEAALLRQTVSAHGYHVVLLDDEAETIVHYISNK
jgi:Pentapeptide repeats (9 copies)